MEDPGDADYPGRGQKPARQDVCWVMCSQVKATQGNQYDETGTCYDNGNVMTGVVKNYQ